METCDDDVVMVTGGEMNAASDAPLLLNDKQQRQEEEDTTTRENADDESDLSDDNDVDEPGRLRHSYLVVLLYQSVVIYFPEQKLDTLVNVSTNMAG